MAESELLEPESELLLLELALRQSAQVVPLVRESLQPTLEQESPQQGLELLVQALQQQALEQERELALPEPVQLPEQV